DWDPRASVTVVMAAENYPGTPTTGDIIRGLDTAEGMSDISVLHAGTKLATGSSGGFAPEDAVITKDIAETGDIVTSGGRVLSVVSLGADPDRARHTAHAAGGARTGDGEHHRRGVAEARLRRPGRGGPHRTRVSRRGPRGAGCRRNGQGCRRRGPGCRRSPRRDGGPGRRCSRASGLEACVLGQGPRPRHSRGSDG